MNRGDKGVVIAAQVLVFFGGLLVLPGLWGGLLGWLYLGFLILIQLVVICWHLWWRKRPN